LNKSKTAQITVSLISHGHGRMVQILTQDLKQFSEVSRVFLTQNIPEPRMPYCSGQVKLQVNAQPRGYGANHNAAFRHVRTPYFCVLNPDLRIRQNPFPDLLKAMEDRSVGVCGPRITTPNGIPEDSHRFFPGPGDLLLKAFGRSQGKVPNRGGKKWEQKSWLAGMFLLFRTEAFARVGGFDEKFFLYYEDVDICARLIARGYRVRQVRRASVVHDARRQSRRDLQYANWHLQSITRYFWKKWTGAYRKLSLEHPKSLPAS